MNYRAPYRIPDRKIRFAVVGCGRISDRHFDAIRQHIDRAELVAVCDSDEAALQAASTQLGVKGYASLDELLAASDCDVITVCTPSGLHPSHAVQIARAGRHVITEKPMATRLGDGKRMVAACDEAVSYTHLRAHET